MHNRINHGQNNTLKTILNRKEEDSWAMENKAKNMANVYRACWLCVYICDGL